MFVLVAVVYANTNWGGVVGIFVGALGAGGIGGGMWGYYDVAIRGPVGSGLNLSAQVFESDSIGYGVWLVGEQPFTEIPMTDEQRKMPMRIPVGYFGKNPSTTGQTSQELATNSGLTMIEEIHTRSPSCSNKNCTCEYHSNDFSVDNAEIFHRLPFLEFETHAYVATPNQGGAPFKQAVIISPCEIDKLRTIKDLIFFRNIPVMGRTTYVSLTRVFEMDERDEMFGAPMYVITHSTWHVGLTQRLAGFIPAYMVPNRDRVVETYNMWGVERAMKLNQQLTTAHDRISALESQLNDFTGQVYKTAWSYIEAYFRTRQLPKIAGQGILSRKGILVLLIAAAAIGITITLAYLLHLI